MANISKIVVHCAATQNGVPLGKNGVSAAQRIDDIHQKRGFHRSKYFYTQFNPHLKAIGYHFVIDVDGTVETGRMIGETGAHVRGHNKNSVGICLVGGIAVNGKRFGRYTKAQWFALHELLLELAQCFPDANVYGHRDFSPDLNGDGKITQNEFMKDCPCFDVEEWLESGDVVNVAHLFKE